MLNGHLDCLVKAMRMALAYAPHGRKSCPKECRIITRLRSGSAAVAGLSKPESSCVAKQTLRTKTIRLPPCQMRFAHKPARARSGNFTSFIQTREANVVRNLAVIPEPAPA